MNKTTNGKELAHNPLEQDLDTVFAKIKADFDKMAASTSLKSPQSKIVNGFFSQTLKAKNRQPWHSLIRTDKKGKVINEVIRIEGVSKEKRSVADQAWFAQVSKTRKEHTDIIKTEKTGRYYLLWAAPIISKVKGAETFQGAVVAQIDLWDCFDQFSDIAPSSFMIRILGRTTLYDHQWKDTIKYLEKPLTVAGIDKITVRYPAPFIDEAAIKRTADSVAQVQARLDSIRVQTTKALAAKVAATKKAKSRDTLIGVALVVTGVLILIIALVMLAKNRQRKNLVNAEEGDDRYDNLI